MARKSMKTGATVSPKDISNLVLDRDDLQRRFDAIKTENEELAKRLHSVRADVAAEAVRGRRLRQAVDERDAVIAHLRGQIDGLQFSAKIMRTTGMDMMQKLHAIIGNATSVTSAAAEVVTKITSGDDNAPTVTTKVD